MKIEITNTGGKWRMNGRTYNELDLHEQKFMDAVLNIVQHKQNHESHEITISNQ